MTNYQKYFLKEGETSTKEKILHKTSIGLHFIFLTKVNLNIFRCGNAISASIIIPETSNTSLSAEDSKIKLPTHACWIMINVNSLIYLESFTKYLALNIPFSLRESNKSRLLKGFSGSRPSRSNLPVIKTKWRFLGKSLS